MTAVPRADVIRAVAGRLAQRLLGASQRKYTRRQRLAPNAAKRKYKFLGRSSVVGRPGSSKLAGLRSAQPITPVEISFGVNLLVNAHSADAAVDHPTAQAGYLCPVPQD